jgi:hypothetical protein
MKHKKDKKPIEVTIVPIVLDLKFPNLDTTKAGATENIEKTII